MFSNNTLMSFEQLCEKHNLHNSDFFRYLQLRHYIQHSTTLPGNMEISPVERFLFKGCGKLSISTFYKTLSSASSSPLTKLRDTWGRELAIVISDDEWEDVWRKAKFVSICNRAKSIQLKINHRMHISPNRRHKFNACLSPLCLKCKTEIGTLTHCLWSCSKLQKYWSDILCEIQRILGIKLDLDPLSLLLGLPSKHVMSKHQKKLYCALTFAARKNILVHWIKEKGPTVKGWRTVLLDLIQMEYLTHIVHHRTDHFFSIWNPYLDYVEPEVSGILIRGFH